MRKLLMFIVVLATSLGVLAVNPDYQETVNGVTSNKIIVVGCKAAVGRVYNPSSGSVYDRGFCWSTSPNPTVSNDHTNAWYYDDGNDGNTPDGSTAISSSAGTIYIMEGLQPSTRYYIRPYIKVRASNYSIFNQNYEYKYGKEYVIWTQPAADWEIYQNWDENNPSEYNINTVKKHNGENANVTEVLTWLTSCRQEAQTLFNTWTSFYKRITYNFSDWEDGAHCSYGGDPSFGPTFAQNTGTMMHETGHNLGVGTEWRYQSWDSPLHPTYLWTGERANRVFTLFQDKPDEFDSEGNYTYGGNNTISDGDRVHVCYGLTGNINYIYRVRQAAYYEGMYQDGLPATGGDAGPYYSFETAAYMNGSTETDLNTKYYITNEDIATCSRYLCEENGKLTYKKITSRSDMLSNDAFAWYVIYNPTNAFYFIKNASTGKYFSYNGSDFTIQSSRNEPIKLMPSRNNSTVNGQTLKAYWMTRGILDWEPASLSASRINQDAAAKAGFNLYDDAGYERWFILSADQVNAVGDVATGFDNPGLEQITSLPDAADYYKYFFVFADTERDLTMMQWDANQNGGDNDVLGNHRKAAFYRSRIDLRNDKWALWTMDATTWDGGGSTLQILANANYNNMQMQNEWNNQAQYRTNDNNQWWSRTKVSYNSLPDGYWTIENKPHGGDNNGGSYLGPWNDGNFSDWQEMAFNKTNAAHIGHFYLYKLLRGQHVKDYQDLSAATPGNPLDITYVLENPGAERATWDEGNGNYTRCIGWKTDGQAWQETHNDALHGSTGRFYFDISTNSASTIYQEVEGLPAGYYRFSALASGKGSSNNLALIANGHTNEQTIVPAANDGTRSVVIVQIADGETLRVGVKALGNSGDWVSFDDAKLEYIGTSVPSYRVDDPVLTFENNSYVEDVQSFTYDFIDAVTTDNSVAFTLLNPSAKVLIKKNGTTVKEGSVSLDGTKLTADFSGFTPERNETYTMTLPAGVVGFAGHLSNVERTITFKTSAIAAGYYYLRNNDTGVYLSRGDWGSRACTDNFGLAVYLSTDLDGNTTFQFFDSRQYLKKNGGDGYCYTDEGNRDYAVKMMIEPQGNGVYIFRNREILGGSDQNCLSVWDGYVICDAIPGSHNQGNQHLWEIESIADHHANNDTRNKDAQAAALGITGVSTWAQLEAQMTANYSGEQVFTDITETVDHWQWGAHTAYEHQLTGLQDGIYRITVNALQRATQWDWMWAIDDAYGVNDVRYLYGNDQKTLIMSNTEDGATYSNTDGMYGHNGLYYPNNTPSAERAFEAGKYKNTLYVKVTNGTLNIGIVDPCGIPAVNQWLCYKNLKVERMVSGLVGLEADGITDGGYISSPINSVTIKPLNTELTNVTIANNTKVTIYKDDVQIDQVTPTKSGANLVVTLPTLVNGSTYKLTLDEKKLTYNNNSKNAAFEVSFKTPLIYDGTYYLYNVKTDDFIERRGNDVYTTFLGQPIIWTNGMNGATIKFNAGETNSYIGGRWYSTSNESEGNALRWEATLYNGAYKLYSTNPVDGGWNYLYVNEGGNGDHVASNGRCKEDDNDNNNFNTWSNGTGLWKFMTQTEYDAYVLQLDEANGAPSVYGQQKVALTRKLVGGQWNGFSVPFGFTVAGSPLEGASVKQFSNANGNEISFTDATSIVAGVPYIIKPTSDITNPQFRGVTVTNAEEAVYPSNGTYKFAAHLYNTTLPTNGSVAYISTTDSSIKKLTSGGIKGMRSYFQIPTGNGVKALVLKFDDDATAIMDLDGNITEGAIYTVAGQRMSAPRKGVNIINGKKVLVK